MTCPVAASEGIVGGTFKLVDGFDEHRCCRYCGSLHPDDFMAHLETGEAKLGATDKAYKVYVETMRSSRNPMGKFYFEHLSDAQKDRFVELLNAKRFMIDTGRFYVLPFFVQIKPKDPT